MLREGEPPADDVWESVQFKNPLPFAMTTAPTLVLDNGQVAGQRLSYWANTGEQTTLKINKALSIRTRSVEEEESETNRGLVNLDGWNYSKVPVKGTLTVNNHRKQDVTLVIRRQFSAKGSCRWNPEIHAAGNRRAFGQSAVRTGSTCR